LSKQIGALSGALNNQLLSPPEQRDNNEVSELRNRIDKLQVEHTRGQQEIARRFPKYADLVDPKPPTLAAIRALLRPDEVLLSFFFSNQSSFVWAVPKDAPAAFAEIAITYGDLQAKIKQLRLALAPDAATIADIPPFDLALAYELYDKLLKPVEASWKPAKNLIVVNTNALGTLPLALLPTAPPAVKQGDEPLFAGYRGVAWLARTHSVTMLPTAATLSTLARLPAGSAARESMIGFGDPIFSKEQAEEEARQRPTEPIATSLVASTRGMRLARRASPQLDGVEGAELALLPRLPDTAEELKSIALALTSDPSRVLKLGRQANEQTVKTTDLSKYKVVVFATHGLVPGELNGLTQPALALSAPDVAGVAGDGLLTMEEILALKLDADWVVLSACNTGAGAGTGAEAASGLGRAFFYAGTRAILVTNWPVDSRSARQLTTDLFARQAANPALTRREALRQAMMSLLDGKGFTDANGKTIFTYAHPLFWAPFTIIGDGR
jgi:CHAT domain-containing protein